MVHLAEGTRNAPQAQARADETVFVVMRIVGNYSTSQLMTCQCCSRVGCVNGHLGNGPVCLQGIGGGRACRAGNCTVSNLSGEHSIFDFLGAKIECDLTTQSPALQAIEVQVLRKGIGGMRSAILKQPLPLNELVLPLRHGIRPFDSPRLHRQPLDDFPHPDATRRQVNDRQAESGPRVNWATR